MTDHNKFDHLLDKALSEYGNAAPRDGLEQRLLARLAEQPERSWNWRWLWAAVPVMAAILIAIFLATRPPVKHDLNVAKAPATVRSTPVIQETTTVSSTSGPKIVAARPGRPSQAPSTVARKEPPAAQPKLATFPSGDESAQQARLLLRFVTRTPSEAAQVASEQEEFQKLAEAGMNQDLENRSER
jgi:hypothetical protein